MKSLKEIQEIIPDARKYLDAFLNSDEKKGYQYGFLDGYMQGQHDATIENFQTANKIVDKVFSEQ